MADFRPYPKYRDSGIPWLGEIPKDWGVRRFKYLLQEVNQRSPNGEEQLLSVSQYAGVTPRRSHNGDSESDSRAESLAGYKRVASNDLVVNIMLAWNGSLGVARSDGIVSPAYCVYRFHDQAEPWYFHNLLRLPLYKRRIEIESTGIVKSRLRLYSDDLFRIHALVPSREEQGSIAHFVNTFDRQVDRLLRTKQRLIELLNEQKQAIINKAITRGLDPNVRLKPSGVEWLGNIPKHWEVAALRLRYSVQLGKMLDAKRITGNHPIPYLRNVDVQWDHICTTRLPTMDIREDEYDRYTVQHGDLLVCEGGKVGRAAFWNGDLPVCGYQKALHRLRALDDARDVPRFLYYLLFSASQSGVFVADGNENTIAHLTAEKLRRHRFVFPPRDEQARIVKYLDTALAPIDHSLASFLREIDLLREYRTRLVADVVTGKLDVRGVENPGSDDAEAPNEVDISDDFGDEEMSDIEEVLDCDAEEHCCSSNA